MKSSLSRIVFALVIAALFMAGVCLVHGDTAIVPTSVDQVLRDQDPADAPLSLALMGGGMLALLFVRRRKRR